MALSSAVRCTQSNGRDRCRNFRKRGHLFCRHHLKPTPTLPSSAVRCTKSNGQDRCRNYRKHGKLFCRHHITKPHKPNKPNKQQTKNSQPNISPSPGEIWAFPSESSRLPHSYAQIQRTKESTVEIIPLQFHPITADEILWAERNLPVSSGTFRALDVTKLVPRSVLSHKIGCDRDYRIPGLRSFYRVFPKKGEVWAVWRECGKEERSPLFYLVEVVNGFNEEGVSVVVLELKDGEFRREGLVRKFDRRELLLFSHRVPEIKVAANVEDGTR